VCKIYRGFFFYSNTKIVAAWKVFFVGTFWLFNGLSPRNLSVLIFKTINQIHCGRRACQDLCRPWDIEVCVETVYAVHAKRIQSTQAVETMVVRGKGGCVGGWTRTHPPRRTNINNYRLEIRAGLRSSLV